MKILKIEARNFKPFHNISIPSDGYFKEGFFLLKEKIPWEKQVSLKRFFGEF